MENAARGKLVTVTKQIPLVTSKDTSQVADTHGSSPRPACADCAHFLRPALAMGKQGPLVTLLFDLQGGFPAPNQTHQKRVDLSAGFPAPNQKLEKRVDQRTETKAKP